jgi:hypothetical protein
MKNNLGGREGLTPAHPVFCYVEVGRRFPQAMGKEDEG